MNEVNTIELSLPISGDTVVMKTFLTTGQSRQLQTIILDSGTVSADGKLSNMKPQTLFVMQEKAAGMLITEVRPKEGIAVSFNAEWLSNLPVPDGTLVYSKINELIQESTVSTEERKKS